MGRRKRVDEVKSRAGKHGIEENTRRRQYDRNVVILLKQKYPDVLKQIDEFLLKQNSGARTPESGIIDPVKADRRATQLTLLPCEKDPKRGGRGVRF